MVKKILIVDDDPAQRRLLESVVISGGNLAECFIGGHIAGREAAGA